MVQQNSTGLRLGYSRFWDFSFYDIKDNYLLLVLSETFNKGILQFFFYKFYKGLKVYIINNFFFFESSWLRIFLRLLFFGGSNGIKTSRLKSKLFFYNPTLFYVYNNKINFEKLCSFKSKKTPSLFKKKNRWLLFSSFLIRNLSFRALKGEQLGYLQISWGWFLNELFLLKKKTVFFFNKKLLNTLHSWLNNFFFNFTFNLKIIIAFSLSIRVLFYFLQHWLSIFFDHLRFNFRNFLYLRYVQLIIFGFLVFDISIIPRIFYYLIAKIKNKKIQFKAIRQFNQFISLFDSLTSLKYRVVGFKYQIKGRLRGRKRRTKKIIYSKGIVNLGTMDSLILYEAQEIRTVVGLYGFKLWVVLQEKYNEAITKKILLNYKHLLLDKKLVLSVNPGWVNLVNSLRIYKKNI